MEPIYLRVPEELKRTVEKRASEEGVSVNEWAVEALAEAAGVKGGGEFDVGVTIELLKGVAASRGEETISYGEVAEHQGRPWSWKVKQAIQRHLVKVWEACRQRGLPSLTSLVVTKAEGKPSEGYLRLERTIRAVTNEAAYVAARQSECREWARRNLQGGASSLDPWPHLRGTWRGPDVENFQDFMRGPPDETDPGAEG